MRRFLLLAVGLFACARPQSKMTMTASSVQAAEPPSGAQTSDAPELTDREFGGSPEAPVEHPPPRVSGCWEEHYGSGPEPGQTPPSLPQAVADCPDCESLKAGPNVQGLHVEVIRRLRAVEQSLPVPPVDEPVLWVNSGAREGSPAASMHNQALAVDVVICGLDTTQTAQHLRTAGFSCVIEYFDEHGKPCNMAHGDLRGTPFAQGPYGVGGRKAKSCPARAVAKGESCQRSNKADWTYEANANER